MDRDKTIALLVGHGYSINEAAIIADRLENEAKAVNELGKVLDDEYRALPRYCDDCESCKEPCKKENEDEK